MQLTGIPSSGDLQGHGQQAGGGYEGGSSTGISPTGHAESLGAGSLTSPMSPLGLVGEGVSGQAARPASQRGVGLTGGHAQGTGGNGGAGGGGGTSGGGAGGGNSNSGALSRLRISTATDSPSGNNAHGAGGLMITTTSGSLDSPLIMGDPGSGSSARVSPLMSPLPPQVPADHASRPTPMRNRNLGSARAGQGGPGAPGPAATPFARSNSQGLGGAGQGGPASAAAGSQQGFHLEVSVTSPVSPGPLSCDAPMLIGSPRSGAHVHQLMHAHRAGSLQGRGSASGQ